MLKGYTYHTAKVSVIINHKAVKGINIGSESYRSLPLLFMRKIAFNVYCKILTYEIKLGSYILPSICKSP